MVSVYKTSPASIEVIVELDLFEVISRQGHYLYPLAVKTVQIKISIQVVEDAFEITFSKEGNQ